MDTFHNKTTFSLMELQNNLGKNDASPILNNLPVNAL